MIVPRVIICPICGKKTYIRIEDGGYLDEYPVRVHCMNCKTLIKGKYVMDPKSNQRGLNLINADYEDCDVVSNRIKNADYVIDISGELPCKKVKKFDGNIIHSSPFLEMADIADDPLNRIERLKYFKANMQDWKKQKSTAFQLLEDGSIDYIAIALHNKIGDYHYDCNHYLKSLHCLQSVVLDEVKYLFYPEDLDELIIEQLSKLGGLDKSKIECLINELGGVNTLLQDYRKAMEIISSFMVIYPNILPAETYIRFKRKNLNVGIATCSFTDIKTFYQDSYESLMSLFYIPVTLDNIMTNGDFDEFDEVFIKNFNNPKQKWRFNGLDTNLKKYKVLDNGYKLNNINTTKYFQRLVNIPANKDLRNAIGHNNYSYDGITQKITCYDLKNHDNITLEYSLIDMAVDCIGLVKSTVIISEMILYLLRNTFSKENVSSIIHPRFYNKIERNDKCPCGSGKKYKKCCQNDIDKIIRYKAN